MVTLEPVTGSWPDRVRAWLLQDQELCEKTAFECEATQTGVEEAIGKSIDWGELNAEDRGRLRRLEIAMPESLMLTWRPEQLVHGLMLGVKFDVIIRWSERINPSRGMQWINSNAKYRLGEIDDAIEGGTGAPPVHWLGKVDLQDMNRLHTQLQSGRFAGALGVAERRSMDARAVKMLLCFSPILMWPDPGDEFPTEHRSVVVEYWESLPQAFIEAYRVGWRGEIAGPLAELRAVWDDEDWLNFVRTIRVGRH